MGAPFNAVQLYGKGDDGQFYPIAVDKVTGRLSAQIDAASVTLNVDDINGITAGGRTPRIVAPTYTRPGSATQYTAGDIIGNSATDTAVVPIDFGTLARDSGRISGARCVIAAASGTIVLPKFNLLLFRANTNIPLASGVFPADNGVFNLSAAAMRELIGVLSFSDTGWCNQLGATAAAGDHAYQAVSFATRPYAPFNVADLATKKIIGVMQDQGGWNPGNVAYTFDFVLDMDQD